MFLIKFVDIKEICQYLYFCTFVFLYVCMYFCFCIFKIPFTIPYFIEVIIISVARSWQHALPLKYSRTYSSSHFVLKLYLARLYIKLLTMS